MLLKSRPSPSHRVRCRPITPHPPARLRAVPARWRDDVRGVLITPHQLARRVRELSELIEKDYSGRDLVIVAVLNGTVLFLADLVRRLTLPLRLDFIGVSSYRQATAPGALVLTKELGLDVRGRHVLVVDDILDTGRTLTKVLDLLRRMRPRSLKTCVLLNKRSRRAVALKADYIGFQVPDLFVVGYGLDFAERFRNLPFIGVLRAGEPDRRAHQSRGGVTGGD